MPGKHFFAEYFSFSQKNRIGIIVLVVMIIAVFIAPGLLPHKAATAPQTNTDWAAALKRLETKTPKTPAFASAESSEENNNAYQYDPGRTNYTARQTGALFYFDPNIITTEEWQRLGLRDKTIHTIQNYLSKGGRFKKPEDLQKIYGLFRDEYERLKPYIRIESTVSDPAAAFDQPGDESKPITPARSYEPRYKAIEINTADTSAFISLPGIGSKLASRIVNFRDKLGGFYSVSQVGETFGLPDSTFQKIKQYLKLENIAIKKININTATVDELKAHPYIKWSLANPIIAYGKEHGSFAKVEDIKKVLVVTEEVYNKIAPYLTL